MPFITEELWAATAPVPRDTLLVLAEWPKIAAPKGAEAARTAMNWVIELIKGVRSVRAEMNVPAGAKVPLVMTGASADSAARLARHIDVIASLARLTSAEAAPAIPKGSAQFVLGEAVIALPLGDVIDFAKERLRLDCIEHSY